MRRQLLHSAHDRSVRPEEPILELRYLRREARDVAAEKDLVEIVPVDERPLRAVEKIAPAQPGRDARGDGPLDIERSQPALEVGGGVAVAIEGGPEVAR